MSWLNLPWDKTRLLKRFDSASVYNQGKINQNKIYLKLCNIFILIVELVTLTKNINVIFKPNFIYNNTCMQCNQKFTFILDENNTLSQKRIHFQFICIFILKLVNSDNSDHYFYIVCKCLSSIIYYDFYMHKVDCFFLFQS